MYGAPWLQCRHDCGLGNATSGDSCWTLGSSSIHETTQRRFSDQACRHPSFTVFYVTYIRSFSRSYYAVSLSLITAEGTPVSLPFASRLSLFVKPPLGRQLPDTITTMGLRTDLRTLFARLVASCSDDEKHTQHRPRIIIVRDPPSNTPSSFTEYLTTPLLTPCYPFKTHH